MLLIVENNKEDDPFVEDRLGFTVEFDRAVWVLDETGQTIAYQLIDTSGKSVRIYVKPGHSIEKMVSIMTKTSGCES